MNSSTGSARKSRDALIRSAARRLTGDQRRLSLAEVATALRGGHPRRAGRHLGWGRDTVATGLHELHSGPRCRENFAARGRRRRDEKDPQLAAAIRAVVAPHAYADPELQSSRRDSNLSAAEVRAAPIAKGYPEEQSPRDRTMRDLLNRMSDRPKRIQGGKPLKETQQTAAIFASAEQAREQARKEPEALETSVGAKAEAAPGDYVRGGKDPDRRR